MPHPDSVRTAADVTALATWTFGRPFEPQPGVAHVVSVSSDAGALMVMRIRPETPRSPYDRFVLSLARARADAIVTTGRILREEPTLRHQLLGTDDARTALEAWGRDVRGHDNRRLSIVLTGGRGFPANHPMLSGPNRVVVMCPEPHTHLLRERLRDRPLEILGFEDLQLAAVIDTARERFGAQTVLLEAGPATVRPLYTSGNAPHELMLSEYLGVVPSGVRGTRLVSRALLEDAYGAVGFGPTTMDRGGDPWRFAWLARAPER